MPADPCDPLALGRAWRAVLGRLEFDASERDRLALRGGRIVRIEGGVAIIEGRSAASAEWMAESLAVPIRDVLRDVFSCELEVRFVQPTHCEPVEALQGASRVTEHATPRGRVVAGQLNRAYTLERYILAAGNRVAYECCTALLESGAMRMNPVVLWSAPGMGKTHLMHALAALAVQDGRTVACVSAEQFMNGFMKSIRSREVEQFQEPMRGVDLLLIDDLQYVQGKSGIVDQIVHTIDAVKNSGGDVVIASECHPSDLDVSERLISRLSEGIVTPVEAFAAEERRAYVNRLEAECGYRLPSLALERIVNVHCPSVRGLQGAAHIAFAMLRATGTVDLARLDAELARFALPELTSADADRLLLRTVAKHFDVSVDDLSSHSRKEPVKNARAAATLLLKERGRSLSEIGAIVGRDKSTVHDMVRKGMDLFAEDPGLRRLLAG